MADPDRSAPINFSLLEESMRVLSYPSRFQLLAILRVPRTLDEILLRPGPGQSGSSPERPISRQGVHQHLAQMKKAGLVRVRSTEREGRRSQLEYVVDRPKLYALVEEMRRISTLGPLAALEPDQTMAIASLPEPTWSAGPKVVLVHGVHEGQAYPLVPSSLRDSRGWIIGRSQKAHVPLDYDPFLSLENSEILKRGSEYRLLDLRTARNGTALNWRRMPVGGDVALRSGDVIGVGRSLLLFRAD